MIVKTSKGPWVFSGSETAKRFILRGSEDRAEPIAIVPFDDVDIQSSNENYANMRLISQAPKLYKILNDIIKAKANSGDIAKLIEKAEEISKLATFTSKSKFYIPEED